VSPLPAKFFGFGTIPNGTARVAFLSGGEGDVYVVKEGELFMNRFRINKIGNNSLEYEEVATGLRGTAPLEEQAAPQ
jgi:Tfp pilus assembly protein PilP